MQFIELEDIEGLHRETVDELYKNFCNPALYKIFKAAGINQLFTTAEGMHVNDGEGNEYLDFTGGFGALNLGHNPKEVQKAVQDAFFRVNLLQVSKSIYAAVLAGNISHLTGEKLQYCVFTNSGTETVEEAVKLTVLYKKGGNILYCKGGYHGKTLGSISALGTKSKEKYKPLLFPFIEIPFGDIEVLEDAVKKHKVSGILIEPVQAEGGVILPAEGYFKKVSDICKSHGIVLILDEIQTGLGRCGTMFCYEQMEFVPDILCLSKSLGGGIMPVGCMCVKKELFEDTYGKLKNATDLGTTFGGNTLSCAAAIKTLSIIKNQSLHIRARRMGAYAMAGLQKLKKGHGIIKDVRGIGLLIGIEFDVKKHFTPQRFQEAMTSTVISMLLNKHRIITGFAVNNPSVLKFEPPLIVTEEQIDYFISSLDDVLKDNETFQRLAVNTLQEISGNIF